VCRAGWQAHREHRTLAQLARHSHIAAHHARELASNGKAKPRAAIAARGQRIGLGEILGQFRLLLGGQADAGVRDGKLDPVASVRHLAHAQGNLALLRELTGVAQEIEQNLLEPHGVRSERANVLLCFDNEAVLVLLGELSRRADNLVDEAASGEWLRTFAIITTNANELVADIHDRMPLILAPDDYARWLDQVITVYAQ